MQLILIMFDNSLSQQRRMRTRKCFNQIKMYKHNFETSLGSLSCCLICVFPKRDTTLLSLSYIFLRLYMLIYMTCLWKWFLSTNLKHLWKYMLLKSKSCCISIFFLCIIFYSISESWFMVNWNLLQEYLRRFIYNHLINHLERIRIKVQVIT
jgi:hypothetical protein